MLSGLLDAEGPCGERFECRLNAALVLLASCIPRGLEWLLTEVQPDAEGEPALPAVARIIADRIWRSQFDCEARTATSLGTIVGIHDAWR